MRRSIEQGQERNPPRPPTPDQLAFLEDEPDDDTGVMIMCRAYAELSSCRSFGMSAGPIPWTAMLDWCSHHGLTRDVTNHVIDVMRFVDKETLRRESVRLRKPPDGG